MHAGSNTTNRNTVEKKTERSKLPVFLLAELTLQMCDDSTLARSNPVMENEGFDITNIMRC
jgi:hypothetical protein